MSKDQDAYKQIALTLATHFDGLYYVDIESGSFNVFVAAEELKEAGLPISQQGKHAGSSCRP